MRVTDVDRDVTSEPDRLKVELEVKYIVEEEETAEAEDAPIRATGVRLEEKRVEVRDTLQFELVETGNHTGVFTGALPLTELEPGVTPSPDDQVLHARQGDTIKITYRDAVHINGMEEEERTFEARALGGSMQDVKATIRMLNDLELQALPIERTADGHQVAPQLGHDVLDDPVVRRRRRPEHRRGRWECGDDPFESAVVGPEVVAPIRDAVHLVDDE